MSSKITRTLARKVEEKFEWIDKKQPLNEKGMCTLIDWTIRHAWMCQSISVLRNQIGEYFAIIHYSERVEDVNLWTPEGRSIRSLLLIDQSKPVIHDRTRTIIPTNQGPITLRRVSRHVNPWDNPVMIALEASVDPAPAHWSFIQTQEGARYCHRRSTFPAHPNDPSEPRIYSPISHRGQFIPQSERATAQAMRDEYKF
ncbi:MAG: hypothetical protein F4X66_16135 [Chloroflexi bacterium]|nr:hypothetical protein [Chloroflexota bacterium]MYE41902.1 hypothetical protein [Chloroflexota bacterium]